MDGIDLKNFCGGALQEKVNEAAKQVLTTWKIRILPGR